MVGLAEMALTALPLRLGVPEWEFGTAASLFSSLPMLTIGAATLLGLVFPSTYLLAAVFSLWHLSRAREGGDHA